MSLASLTTGNTSSVKMTWLLSSLSGSRSGTSVLGNGTSLTRCQHEICISMHQNVNGTSHQNSYKCQQVGQGTKFYFLCLWKLLFLHYISYSYLLQRMIHVIVYWNSCTEVCLGSHRLRTSVSFKREKCPLYPGHCVYSILSCFSWNLCHLEYPW